DYYCNSYVGTNTFLF
nr:immunoglobulin light chain junction region [Macaca mulatta]